MKEVIILFSSIVDVNIFHFFALEVSAIWNTISKTENNYILYLENYEHNGVHLWRKALLTCILPTFTCVEEMHKYCREQRLFITDVTNVEYTQWIIDPWKFVEYCPEPSFMKFASIIKHNLGLTQCEGIYATLVTRKKSRILLDNCLQEPFEEYFAQSCRQNNIPFKIVCFDNMSLKEQAVALSDTKVMLSCHGAGNTNVFLLPHNGHLLEINFRKHWYCDPVCEPHFTGQLPSKCKCDGKLTWRPYFHKADYHNLAKFFGKKYTELEFEFVEGFIDTNPINVKNVYIDSKYIMQHVFIAMNSEQ
jgi:hypothetical protein